MTVDLEKVKKVDWQYLVSRREALLVRSFTANCYKFFKKVTGINWEATLEFRPGDLVLYSAKELGELRSLFLKDGVPLFKSFRKQLIIYMNALDKVANDIAKINCSKLKKSDLVRLATKFVKYALYGNNFLLPMPIADGVISKMILDSLPQASDQEKQNWLGALAYPKKENEHTKEERSFYKIAKVFKTNPQKAERLIKTHLKRYAWIGARGYWWWRAWIGKDVECLGSDT